MEVNMKITVETKIAASIDKVWNSYTSPDAIVQWNAASDDWHTVRSRVDLKVGGEFSSRMEAKDGSEGFDFAGIYTKIVPNKLIEYTFGDRKAKVEFANDENAVVVKVTFDAEKEYSIEQQRNGWQAILDNFRKYVVQN
jgi:uncharacterized protein YndB with AHSA1/START domain